MHRTHAGRRAFDAVGGRHRVVGSAWIRNEVQDGLGIPYVRDALGPQRAASLLNVTERRSGHVPEGFPVVAVAPDPDDDPIIATAVDGAAGMLVTGDRKLPSVGRHAGVVIVGIDGFLSFQVTEGRAGREHPAPG